MQAHNQITVSPAAPEALAKAGKTTPRASWFATVLNILEALETRILTLEARAPVAKSGGNPRARRSSAAGMVASAGDAFDRPTFDLPGVGRCSVREIKIDGEFYRVLIQEDEK